MIIRTFSVHAHPEHFAVREDVSCFSVIVREWIIVVLLLSLDKRVAMLVHFFRCIFRDRVSDIPGSVIEPLTQWNHISVVIVGYRICGFDILRFRRNHNDSIFKCTNSCESYSVTAGYWL